MNRISLGLTTAALAIAATAGGVVYAAQADENRHGMHRMMADPFGDATITRADAINCPSSEHLAQLAA